METQTINKPVKKIDFTTGSIPKKMLAFVIPILIMNLVQCLYGIADMAIVGHFIGPAGMSAANMGGLITNIVLFVINGLGNGGNIYIGQLVGSGKAQGLPKIIGTMLTGFVSFAAVFSVLLIFLTRPILVGLDTPAESLEYAVTYLTICLSGTIFVYGYNVFAAVYRAIGRSLPTMIFVTITVVLNILLDLLFVGPFHMGIGGAALATILSQFICFLITSIHIYKIGLFSFKKELLKIDWPILKTIIKIGFPQVLQFTLTSVSFLLISGFVNKYGVTASALAGAVTKTTTFAIAASHAFQAGMVTFTAQNIVQHKINRIIKCLILSAFLSFIVAGCFLLASLINPQGILSIFTSDPAVLNYEVHYLQVMLLASLVESVMFCLYGLIAGSGHTMVTFFCAIISAFVVRFFLVWLFSTVTTMGFMGIAWAYVCAPSASGTAALLYILSKKWYKSTIM